MIDSRNPDKRRDDEASAAAAPHRRNAFLGERQARSPLEASRPHVPCLTASLSQRLIERKKPVSTWRRQYAIALSATALSLAMALAGGSATAAQATPPEFALPVPVVPAPGAWTVPHFTSAFTSDGQRYEYTMVGTDPALGPATTVIPAVIVPLRVLMADGTVFDATDDAQAAASSPIFRPAQFPGGFTQYGDAHRRGEFWETGGSGDYHVLLGGPEIRPAHTISVPEPIGTVERCTCGLVWADIDEDWYLNRVLEAVHAAQIPPTSLPIVLTDHVRGGALGHHFAGTTFADRANGRAPVQPFIEASWWNHERAAAPDSTALSHEIAEWLDNPFITNRVPAWRSPIPTNPYGCSTHLEVADPLVIPRRAPTVVVNGYHLSNLVYISWFARQSPSIGLDGAYTMFPQEGFDGPSPSC